MGTKPPGGYHGGSLILIFLGTVACRKLEPVVLRFQDLREKKRTDGSLILERPKNQLWC
jgi:hypothetical protein